MQDLREPGKWAGGPEAQGGKERKVVGDTLGLRDAGCAGRPQGTGEGFYLELKYRGGCWEGAAETSCVPEGGVQGVGDERL